MSLAEHLGPSGAGEGEAVAPPPAATNDDLVPRPRLLDRLREDRGKTLILQAPSGFGKSVLLKQLAARDPRPSHTVLLTAAHNDPVVLVRSVADALAASEPLPDDVVDALQAPSPDIEGVVMPRLLSGIAARRVPCLLALDELERLDSAGSLGVVEALLPGLPGGSQLAIATRVEPPLRMGRLRASRRLVDLRQEELTMTRGESAKLLTGLGLDLGPAQLEKIVSRTEGWPAALYLAGLAISFSSDPTGALSAFAGDDRVVVDYLEEEFLLPVSQQRLEFLRRASVLERMCGDLCDVVLERRGSAKKLRNLSRTNMLLVHLDRSDTWLRFHPLLRDMLRSELRRSEPEAERGLHLRAAAWWEARGDWDQAINHAVEAGATELAGELLWAATPEFLPTGRVATIDAWLERLGEAAVQRDAGLSLTACWTELTFGRGAAGDRWAAATRRNLEAEGGSNETRTSLQAGLVLADATLARDGLEAMRAAIESVEPLLDEDDPWRTLCCLLDGVGLHLSGERDRGRARLEEGARRGSVHGPNLQCISLAQLALLCVEVGDMPAAEREIARARRQINRYGLAEYPMIAIALAASALIHSRRGATDAARRDLDAARARLDELDHFTPWYEVEARLVIARAALRLGDRAAARELAVEAARLLRDLPDAVVLSEWLAELEASLLEEHAGPVEQLTAAELRILQQLPSHLTYPQIAAAAFVSPNTVKTHARGIYRKLGVSSRKEAIERAEQAGLLGDPIEPPRT